MSAKIWKLAALWTATESTFGTDPSSNGSAFKFLKCQPDMTFHPMQDVIERPGLTYDLTRQAHIIGQKAGQLTFKTELKGSGTAAASTIASIAAESDPLLKALLGTVTRGTGDTISGSSSTTTVLNVTTGANFAVGMMIHVDCGATYGKVPRFIASISSNALTVDRALPAIPATSAVVYATSLYTRANGGQASLSFCAKRDGIEYTFVGCKIDSCKVAGITSRGAALIDWQISVSDWTVTTKGSLPSSALTGITATPSPVVKASCFAVGGTEELAYSLDFDFGSKFAFQDSTCALGPAQPDSANAGLVLTDSMPGGTVKSYYASAHMVDFAAGTQRSLVFACPGAIAGNGWGLYIPNAQWLQPAFEDHSGMVGETLPFLVNDNGTASEFYLSLC